MNENPEEVLLTTVDNPYNPFTQWDEWYTYDIQLGYDTCGFLARLANTSSELSDNINAQIVMSAMDEIIKFNLSGKHIKVTKNNFDNDLKEGERLLSIQE